MIYVYKIDDLGSSVQINSDFVSNAAAIKNYKILELRIRRFRKETLVLISSGSWSFPDTLQPLDEADCSNLTSIIFSQKKLVNEWMIASFMLLPTKSRLQIITLLQKDLSKSEECKLVGEWKISNVFSLWGCPNAFRKWWSDFAGWADSGYFYACRPGSKKFHSLSTEHWWLCILALDTIPKSQHSNKIDTIKAYIFDEFWSRVIEIIFFVIIIFK